MAKSKALAESRESPAPATVVQRRTEPPEKQVGPRPAMERRSRSPLPPPSGGPPAGPAADILTFPGRGSGETRRAQMSRSMQGTVGNARLSRMAGGNIQAKLKVGAPNDPYEQEADDAANRVVSGQKVARISRIAVGGLPSPVTRQESEEERLIQRQADEKSEEEAVRQLPLEHRYCRNGLSVSSVMRLQDQEELEEEAPPETSGAALGVAKDIQAKAEPDEGSAIEDVNAEARIMAPGGGRPLPENVRREMEVGLGADFSKVRVHDTTADQANAGRINAKAFTCSDHVWLGAGQSVSDHKLMAHELTHVVQQGAAQAQNVADGPREYDGVVARRSELALQEATAPETPIFEINQGFQASISAMAADTNEQTCSSERRVEATAADSGRALPPTSRARMEAAFNHDFGSVRIHTGERAAKDAADRNAHAITVGRDISFGANEFAPHTTSGDRLLAHELTHVVQHDDGRMPFRGALSPNHVLEREAYATERRIIPTLPRIDDQLGTHGKPSGGLSRYSGEPTLAHTIDEQEPSGVQRRRQNTTETALMGSLPSAEEARAEAAPPQPLIKTPQATPAAPLLGASGLMREAQGLPVGGETMVQPEQDQMGNQVLPPIQVSAAGNDASPPLLVLQPAPVLRDPMAWVERLAIEGAQSIEKVQASAAASIERIRAQAGNSIKSASSTFDAARVRFESTAQTAFAQIETFRADAAQSISVEVAAKATELDTHFATSSENALASADEARARITQTKECETNRCVSESAARAGRARRLAQSGHTDAEGPLAEGLREIASRVSDEMAQQCLLTGRDAAAEVHKAGESRITGIDAYLDQVLQTLDSARNLAHEKLAQSRAEATAVLDEQLARTTEETEARRAEGISGLDQQEASLKAWIQEQSEQQCAQIATQAEEGVANISTNIESISERFNEAIVEVKPIFTTPPSEESGIGPAQDTFSEEMSRIWTAYVAPQLSQGEQIAMSFDEHAEGVEQGLMRVSVDAILTLERTVSATIEGLATLAERFGNFVETASERAISAVRHGIAGACAEADRAVSEHTTDVRNEANQAEQAIQSAVNEQLVWENQQIDRASEEILAGQSQAAQQYRSLEAQARARDEAETSAGIARGWLGDLWDWFSDLAESTLEWFQEKLGPVWGNIIGHILRGHLYAVGVLVCAVSWVAAQAVNLVWGFIWGETAIPGYGGGIFNFIGDIISGILVVGDIRDLFKYAIWRPFISEEGPWWLNLGLFILTALFLVPLYGDIGKIIFKAIKGGGKGVLKLLVKALGEELAERIMRKLGIEVAEEFAERLAREVGDELAQRMIRELGTEGAEELLERLGAETLQHLSREISPTVIRNLAGELGERTLKRLAESLGGNVIQTLSNDLGREAIEKLLRTVGPSVVEELHRHLGKDALLNLLKGLRGVTVKEYLDALGGVALRNLGRDLEGYAVKELFDDLGAHLLRRLGTDLGGETVQRLASELGAPALRELSQRLAPTTIRDLVDELGKDLVLRFKDSLGVDGLRQITDAISPADLKAFVQEIGEEAIERFGARALAEVGPHLRPTELLDLLTSPGTSMAFLRSLSEEAGVGAVLRTASTHFGSIADLGKVLARAELHGAPAAGLKQFLERCPANGWRKINEIEQYFRYAASSGSSWSDLIRWAETLCRNTLGDVSKVHGRNVADPSAPYFRNLVDAAGNAVRITFNSYDALHVAARHTWERFAVTTGNANKLGNDMFPDTIRAADIEAIGARLLQKPDVASLVATISPGNRGLARVVDGSFTYEIMVTLQNGADCLVTFYPKSGPGVEHLTHNAMRAIICLFHSI